MDPKWHIAFCNMTYTKYAGMTYSSYYASPANSLAAQLKAKEVVEQRFGVGRFINPHVDTPAVTFASFLGMPVVEPEGDDELPYVDVSATLLDSPRDADRIRCGDPKTDGLMAKRWQGREYYRAQGYAVGLGGYGGGVVTTACEISANQILAWCAEDPEGARTCLDRVTDAVLALREFDESLSGSAGGGAYTGDDFSGMLSPRMYRELAVPCYERIYAGRSSRSMHSELLRAEHLRIAKDLLQITSFHGAGCENLTLAEMHDIMGNAFWTQLTPREMLEFSPARIDERIREFADRAAAYVQLYPGRDTPDRNMEAAIAAVQRECPGGSTA